ncbi:hypothetical protein HY643_03620 [Candidatus Woesearchaeota archaeon]|nr:hypothetical protein [Candidatus Woesearchaeota archaeon]
MSKAQIGILDLIIAAVLFMAVAIPSVYFWNLTRDRLITGMDYSEMQVKAFQLSDLLIKSEGKPTKWENTINETLALGLAESDRAISPQKLSALNATSYNTTRKLLNVGIYSFKIRLTNPGNEPIMEYGKNFTGQSSVVIERYVTYEGEKIIFEFTLWK